MQKLNKFKKKEEQLLQAYYSFAFVQKYILKYLTEKDKISEKQNISPKLKVKKKV